MRIRSGRVELRAFEPGLSDALYEVRNHPSVRRHLRDPRPIARESHDRWVQANLVAAQTVHLFVAFGSGAPAGIALLRDFRGREAEIGVMIVEPERRRLVAYVTAHLIGYYAFEMLDLERLVSRVPLHHERALAFNLSCGFEPTREASAEYHVLALTQARSRTHSAHRKFRASRAIVVQEKT
jgi:RimJ/RimL family protein N-acetyltransferase